MAVVSQAVDFKSTLTDGRVQYAYGMAQKMMDARAEGWARIGMKAAKAGDAKLMMALDRMAECTSKEQEAQFGQTMRSASATYGETRGTTEHQLCREALLAMERGEPLENFQWIYGSAAWLCGYNL